MFHLWSMKVHYVEKLKEDIRGMNFSSTHMLLRILERFKECLSRELTSGEALCEHIISRARLLFGNRRRNTTPETLERIIIVAESIFRMTRNNHYNYSK